MANDLLQLEMKTWYDENPYILMLSRFSQTENGKIKAPADLVVGKGLLPHSELIFFLLWSHMAEGNQGALIETLL